MIMLNEWIKLFNTNYFNTNDKTKLLIGGWNPTDHNCDKLKKLTSMYGRILVRIKTDKRVPVSFDPTHIYLANITIEVGAIYKIYISNKLVYKSKYYREVVRYINEII